MTENLIRPSRRERAKAEKQRRIMDAARALFAERGVGRVTTQQIADRADVAIGTLYLYAVTKAELLILVQNQKFENAIDDGLAAARRCPGDDTVGTVLALLEPVVGCIREHPENGRTYLNELVFGDPTETHRRTGLAIAVQLEEGIAGILAGDVGITTPDAVTLARVITSIIHVTTTASVYLPRTPSEILEQIRRQISVIVRPTRAA
ncbi:TetR/AcrR family transcriptional regulator [Microbacterium sp. cx-59]|uniref:TetR/AcrR family transcriptional regulator n=1 Tax=Microbacterium sp. cx-59 TaxID=2891207 RepID=UPI001E531514|nr:TetR/AcrR family transcriptional regulator [Microbacterium sp. cx-59]MCC4908809.1 TetR/AcrR family transcriptional regulator [Microbacterium sp. cx-59]